MTSASPPAVGVFDVDPELGAGIEPSEQDLARRVAVVPRLDLTRGMWEHRTPEQYATGAFALLIVEGLVTCDVVLGERTATQLLGPGDVVHPWRTSVGLVPAEIQWAISEPTQLAILEDRFAAVARRWPSVGRALHDRVAEQIERAALHTAICQLPRVEERLLALLWLLAERWGRVAPTGVVVPLRLTHEALGRLVGAQRPTVSLALRDLAEEGSVGRRDDGAWVLRGGSQADLTPSTAPSRIEIEHVDAEATPDRAYDGALAARERALIVRRLEALRNELPARAASVSRLVAESRELRAHGEELRERSRKSRERASR